MSYYVSTLVDIHFAPPITEAKVEELVDRLKKELCDLSVDEASPTCFAFGSYGNHDDDYVEEFIDDLKKITHLTDGEWTFSGETGERWGVSVKDGVEHSICVNDEWVNADAPDLAKLSEIFQKFANMQVTPFKTAEQVKADLMRAGMTEAFMNALGFTIDDGPER